MDVSIWNKKISKWLRRTGIKQIYQDKKTIELDFNKSNMETFDTDTYELMFIHREGA